MTDWQPPADVMPWIVCAACRYGEYIVAGPRHFDSTMHRQIMASQSRQEAEWEQGFIDQWGRFYNRTAAMAAVKASGQPFNKQRNGGDDTELYSEGLY